MRNLSQEQVEVLGKAFKKTQKGQEKIRYHALWLLGRGYKRKEVLTILGISKQVLGNWVTIYNKSGLKGLETKAQPGNHHKLTKVQKQKIKNLITVNTPSQLGL